VVFKDGSIPPKETIVRLYCPEGDQPQAYVDSEGGFLFSVGGNRSFTITDSRRSMPGPAVGASGPDQSFVSMSQCVLRAFLPGYTSSRINLSRRSVFENTDVGVLVLTPGAEPAGEEASLRTLAAPKPALKAFEQGKQELARKKPNAKKAAKALGKAVKEYPEFTEAWNLLGQARILLNDLDGAHEALERAVASAPNYYPPYVTLALMELQGGKMAEAANYADRAVALEPGLAEANYYRAIAYSNLGDAAKAEESIRAVQASENAARYPRTHFLLGNILLGQGDVPAAAAEFRRYLELEPESRAAAAVRGQLAKWDAQGLLKP